MKFTLPSVLAVFAFGLLIPAVRADHDHARFRTYDDLAFSALISARELRWELHDDFVESRSYDHLLRDADILMEHLRDLQRLILREESNRTIHHHVDTVIAHVADLRRCLLQSDFARGGGHPHTSFHNPGVLFDGVPRQNPYRVHVEVALGYLGQVDANLQSLCVIMSGRSIPPVIMPYNLSVPRSNGVIIPNNGVVPNNGVQFRQDVRPLPAPEPVGPVLGPQSGTDRRHDDQDHKFVEKSGRQNSTKTIEIPINGKNGGGFRIRN